MHPVAWVTLALLLSLVPSAWSATTCPKLESLIYKGDVTITTSADFTQLKDKCAIEGDLNVTSAELTNLDGLSAITHVTGSVEITGNPSLVSLEGISQLRSVDGVLWISENDSLTEITGFNELLKTGGLVIEGNPSVTTIAGFAALQRVHSNLVAINDNDKLVTLIGFGSLVKIDKDFNFYGNASIKTLGIFNALSTVGGQFKIWDNTALVSIAGFKALKTVGSSQSDKFYLAENTALKAVPGFTTLASVTNLNIEKNSAYPTNMAECLAGQITVTYYKLIAYNGASNTTACNRSVATETPTSTQTATDSRTGLGRGTDTQTGTATLTQTQTQTTTATETSTTTATVSSTASSTGTSTGTSTGSATGTGTGSEDSSSVIDFTGGSLPSGVTNSDCELVDGKLQLGKNSQGTFLETCHVDFAVSGERDSGIMVRLDGTRMDLIVDGDFASYSTSTVGLSDPANSSKKTALTTGQWFSDANYAAYAPAVSTSADGDQDVAISSSGSLMQILPIRADQEIRFDFAADASALNSYNGKNQLFYLSAAFLTKDLKVIKFLDPNTDTVQTALGNFKNYENTRGAFEDSIVVRGVGCGTQVKYNGDGISPDKTYFDFCQNTDGTALTDEDGTVYAEEDIAYLMFTWDTNWSGTGSTTLKYAHADPLDQFRISLVDSSGNELKTSVNDDKFYLGTFTGDATMRVTLTSYAGDKSPALSKIYLGSNEKASVTSGDLEIEFTKPRMGFGGAIAPVQEWADNNTIRTQCLDIFNGDQPLNCLDFLSRYGMSRLRTNIRLMLFDTTLSGTTITHALYKDHYTDKTEGSTLVRHIAEAQNYGMEILLIIDHANCEGSYYFGGTRNCYWDTSGNLNTEFDTTPTDSSDNEENSFELMNTLAQYLVTQFDGGHEIDFTDGTVKPGKISYFEIGVETDITEPVWKNNLDDDEEARYLAGVGSAVHAIRPDALVETSVNPYNSYYVQTFHYDYIEDVLHGVLEADADSYTHFNFNLFTENADVQIEDWLEDFEELKSKSYFDKWKDKKFSIGAYDVTHNIYDPACFDTWEKDNGIKRAAKLTARMIVTGLSLPVEDMYDYVLFNSDGYSAANNVSGPDTCWLSTHGTNIFDRQPGGMYDGKDEASTYKLNEVGIATMTLAKNLSISSPYATTIDSEMDGLYVKIFSNQDGDKVLAVWRQDQTEYASDFMSHVSGHTDNGDTREYLLDIELKNLQASTATRIPLDGASSSSLTIEGSTIRNVLLEGDMPVLILIK